MSKSATVFASPISISEISTSAVCGMYFGKHSTSIVSRFCTNTASSILKSSLPNSTTGTLTLIVSFWLIAWKSTCKY